MKRIGILLFIGVMGLGMTCANVWAQATAQISGTVHDQSGAVLPGVEVTATQTERAIARTAVTNETGSYVLSNLPLGPYRVEAALTGFRTFVQTGIVLQVNSSPAVNPVLQVGQVTEQIEVQANAAQVETRSTAVGEVIETQRILDLPLPARNVTSLITLTAGSSLGGAGSVPGGFVRGTSAASNYVSVGGGLYFGVMYALDGASITMLTTIHKYLIPFRMHSRSSRWMPAAQAPRVDREVRAAKSVPSPKPAQTSCMAAHLSSCAIMRSTPETPLR